MELSHNSQNDQKLQLTIFNTQPPHLYIGGVETRIIQVSKNLPPEIQTTVVCGTKKGFIQESTINKTRYVPSFCTNSVYPMDNWFFNQSISNNNRLLDASVFESHNVSGYKILQKLKSKGQSSRFIETIHGPLADEYAQSKNYPEKSLKDKLANRAMKYLLKTERTLAQEAQTIVTVSQYSRNKIVEYYQVEPSKIRIIPNGVDCQKYRPLENYSQTKKNLGIPDKQCVLYVGQLIPRKGLPHLIDAAEKIVKTYKETVFLIAGDGPLKERLIQRLQKSNLLNNFMFLGNVTGNRLVELYNCADVFVLPSATEGQGIVLLEAQAVQKPVVAFNVGAISESVANNESGLLVNPKTDEFAPAILKLLSDENLRTKMGKKGRELVKNNFSWKLCTERMLSLYNEVAGYSD